MVVVQSIKLLHFILNKKQILSTINFLDYEVADDSNDGGKTIWSIFKTVLTERMPRTFFGMIAD